MEEKAGRWRSTWNLSTTVPNVIGQERKLKEKTVFLCLESKKFCSGVVEVEPS